MPQPREIELKLEVPAERAGALGRVAPRKGLKPNKSQELFSVYYDTDKQKLRKNGLSLRVRRVDGRYVQTIKKRLGRSVGLFERNEWQRPIKGQKPDLDAARGTANRAVLEQEIAPPPAAGLRDARATSSLSNKPRRE